MVYNNNVLQYRQWTSSSAVAKRPNDASCLSVVSFNSTKRRVESFIVSYLRRLQICHCLQLNALFCCLWRNVEVSCHKHFVVFSLIQHRHFLTEMCHTQLAVDHRWPCWQHLGCYSVNSRHWSQILAQNRDFCLPHLHSTNPLRGFPSEYCHVVWYGKTRMAWLPDGEKNSKIRLFVLTECTNVTDTHTDRQTPHDDRPRLHSIARQKLCSMCLLADALINEVLWLCANTIAFCGVSWIRMVDTLNSCHVL